MFMKKMIPILFLSMLFSACNNQAPATEDLYTPKMSFQEALEKSASGDISAYYNLAKAYYEGKETNKDCIKAFDFMQKAALAGNKDAMFDLGTFYFEGCGTAVNENKAREWRAKSAQASRIKILENMVLKEKNMQNVEIIFPFVMQGSPEILKKLLKKGLNPNLTAQGTTLLTTAALNPNEQVVEILIKAGASVNPINTRGGATPLMAAAGNPNEKVAELLIKAGADKSKRDERGMGPLDYFKMSENPNIKVKKLLE